MPRSGVRGRLGESPDAVARWTPHFRRFAARLLSITGRSRSRRPRRRSSVPSERMDSLAAVLAAIRGGSGMTQPLLTQQVGLGRSVVAARIAELEMAGLVTQAGMAPSTGGRAPRRLRLRAEAGGGGGLGLRGTPLEG